MYRKKIVLMTSSVCLLLLLAAYGISSSGLFASSDSGNGGSSGTGSNDDTDTSVHEDPTDYVWDSSDVVSIALSGSSITVSKPDAAIVSYGTVTITSAGTYRITGTLANGQVVVDCDDEATVRLILDRTSISCSSGPAIYIDKANKTVIVLADGTQNYLSDGTSYSLDAGEDEPNAAVFSSSDLTICGGGALNIDGNYKDGIASKDGLIIVNGTIVVSARDDGIRGKDYLIVEGGEITLDVGGDGLKSTNNDTESVGYVLVEGGTLYIVSGADGIQAETDVIITGGTLTLTSGGGSSSSIGADDSAKGIKGNSSVAVTGGAFAISSADDAIHSNGNITIDAGIFNISTGDDGIHADGSVTINAGEIDITKSYEGIEGSEITINGGLIHIASSDDGINTSGGNDGSGFVGGPGVPGQQGGGAMNSGTYPLYINEGYIYIDAAGDGIDINGPVVMTGGTMVINGPTANDNGALDFVSFTMNGGFLLAVGSSGMAQSPGTASSQESLSLYSQSAVPAGTMIHIEDSTGAGLLTFTPTKAFSSIVFSSPGLVAGSSYTIYLGGGSTGTVVDGLYTGGAYTPGTNVGSFTIS